MARPADPVNSESPGGVRDRQGVRQWPGVVARWGAAGEPLSPGAPAAAAQVGGSGPLVLVCEHASNRVAAPWGDLGLSAQALQAHIAWDRGALGLARELAVRLAPVCGGAVLVHAPLSRLIHDLNRAPDRPGAMPERSETQDIPGNRGLSPADRQARVDAVYLPFHATLQAEIARALATQRRPVVLTVHSFTPTWHGTPRTVEFGVIHDADPVLAQAIVAQAAGTGLVTVLNAPYSAADDVTHMLRQHAIPCHLPNAMLELRNDLIATPAAQGAMADRLAPVLARAIATVTEVACPAS